MRASHCIFAAILLIWIMSAAGVRAQQQPSQPSQQGSSQQTQQQSQQGQSQDQGGQPIPALRSPLAVGADNSDSNASADANTLAPDERSLLGPQDLTLGSPKTSHSFWQPYLQVSSTLDSTPLTVSGTSGWQTWTTFSGGLDMSRMSGNSNLVMTYLGGGSVSTNAGTYTAVVQQFGFAEDFKFHRSQVVLLDQLAYTPEASFGYAGIGGPSLSVGGNLGLQSGFAPDQNILTALGQRVSNVSAVEYNFFATPRSSFTFVGSYSVLDYFANNLNNTSEADGRVGYNYRINRKDTIAVSYGFDAFRYNHISQSINSNSVQISYARRVTGRLAFQVGGGPDIAFSQTPIATSSTTSTTTPGTTTTRTRQFFWTLSSSATYAWRRTTLQASYSHGVTGGSGVLAGAITDSTTGSATRQLNSSTTGGFSFGYARNEGVVIPGLNGAPQGVVVPTSQTYDYWFGTANFSHTLGRSASVYLSYGVNYQTSNDSFCITVTCGRSYLQHQISISLGWHPGPMGF